LLSSDVIVPVAREKAALRRENKILRELQPILRISNSLVIDLKGEDLHDLIRQSVEPRAIDENEKNRTRSGIALSHHG